MAVFERVLFRSKNYGGLGKEQMLIKALMKHANNIGQFKFNQTLLATS